MYKPIKPLLRWAGSKQKLLPVLSKYWNAGFNRYIEPFVGSAALYFCVSPGKALLSDINRDLISTYTVIRDTVDELYDLVVNYPVDAEFYYAIRLTQTNSLSELEKAARFIYLNRNCYNGLYRTNKKGQFNVPYASYKNGELPSIDSFRRCSELLKGAELISCDYTESIMRAEAGDFIYLDPPYAIKNIRIFNQYDPNSFGLEDINMLVQSLSVLDGKGVKFVLSYANSPEIDPLKQIWNHEVVMARRNIAGFTQNRRMAEEVIFSNL